MSRLRVVVLALLMGAIVLALTPGTSLANKPIYKGADEDISDFSHAKVVPDSAVAWSYYADLAPGKVDIYQIYATGGQVANPTLLVPMLDNLKEFTPTLAFVGPGLGLGSTIPITNTNVPSVPVAGQPLPHISPNPNDLPLPLPGGMPKNTGVFIVDYAGDINSRPTQPDPFTQLAYWKGEQVPANYPQDGVYYVLVWDRLGRGGKYMLALGGADEFGLADTIKFPYTWAKAHIWSGDALSPLIAGLVVLLIIVGLVLLAARRRRTVAVTTAPAPPPETPMPPPSD
jgi:hypothetical protein